MLIKGRVIKVVEKPNSQNAKEADTVVETYKRSLCYNCGCAQTGWYPGDPGREGSYGVYESSRREDPAACTGNLQAALQSGSDPKEIDVLDRLGTQRKALPGQERAACFLRKDMWQQHWHAPIRKNGVANCQAEMGTGKTTISTGVLELLDAYPAIVLCPPHLVPKWIREIEEVIPGAHARELRRIGRIVAKFMMSMMCVISWININKLVKKLKDRRCKNPNGWQL